MRIREWLARVAVVALVAAGCWWAAPSLRAAAADGYVVHDVSVTVVTETFHGVVPTGVELAQQIIDVPDSRWTHPVITTTPSVNSAIYQFKATTVDGVTKVTISWWRSRLGDILGSRKSMDVAVTATWQTTSVESVSATGTLTVRPLVDVYINVLTLDYDSGHGGPPTLDAYLRNRGPSRMPPGVVKITGYGARPSAGHAGTWSSGTITLTVPSDYVGYEPIKAPLAQDWEHLAFTATFVPAWTDTKPSNNSAKFGPFLVGSAGGGSGGGGNSSGNTTGGPSAGSTASSAPTLPPTSSPTPTASASPDGIPATEAAAEPANVTGDDARGPGTGWWLALLLAAGLVTGAATGWWTLRRRRIRPTGADAG